MQVKRIVSGLVLALIGLAAAALAYMSMASKEQAPPAAYTLLDGSQGRVDQLKGQVVLVNFWATSCVSCVKEMPDLVATHEKFKARGFQTLAVAMSYDPPAYVANFAKTRQLPFAVAIDNTGSIARSFGDVKLTPTTVVINKRGEIVKRYVGEPDFAALHALLERLLVEG
jgi:peroxiredoxin